MLMQITYMYAHIMHMNCSRNLRDCYLRFYDSETVNIYKNTYNMSMEESGVFLPLILFADHVSVCHKYMTLKVFIL